MFLYGNRSIRIQKKTTYTNFSISDTQNINNKHALQCTLYVCVFQKIRQINLYFIWFEKYTDFGWSIIYVLILYTTRTF